MNIKTIRVAIGKAIMVALLMAVVMLWATVAIAGMNEDFYEVSMFGTLADVKRLLAMGSDVNGKTNFGGYTALIGASQTGKLKVVTLLLAKGAEVNAKTNFGSTALHWASHNGHPDVVQILLANGADVNVKNNEGYTPLMNASKNGYPEIVQALLAKGADVNAKDKRGRTALVLASVKTVMRIGGGRQREVKEILIKAGAK